MIKFGAIYQNHQDRLFHYILRMTGGDYNLSSDILQESFTRCIERYSDRIESIALIYKIARNLVIDHNRKTCREEPYKDQSAVDEKLIENQVLVKEQYQKVLLALKSLRFDDREILSLVASESFSYREIASILCTTENNVKVRVHRARKRLRCALAK